MRATLLAAVFAALLAGPAAATKAEAIDATVRKAQERLRIPGISVAVLRGDRLLYARGFGRADIASNAPATAETVYPLGSISKQFTAAAVLRLAESGRLALADPVVRHVPEYWPHGEQATLEHLLRHTSGVREFFSVPAAAKLIDDPRGTIDDVMALVAREPLVFPTGSRWSYSNSGYHLAARAIEKATGQPYEHFLDVAFFRPLRLASLHHCKQTPQPPAEATGYGLRGGRPVVARSENMSTARGDGGLCGNAVDLARWMSLLARGEVLAADSFAAMSRPSLPTRGPAAPYGMGLGMLPLDGRPRISHTGEIGGYSAAAAYYPQEQLAIAVLTNLAGRPPESIERAIARTVLGLPTPRTAVQPAPADARRRVAGSWEIGIPAFVIEISDGADGVRVRMPPPGWRDTLRYQGEGRWTSAQEPDVHYVQLPADGDADSLTIGMGDMHWDARRTNSDAASR